MFRVMNQVGVSSWNYVTRSGVEKLIGDNIKAAVEITTRCAFTILLEITIEGVFTGYGEQIEEIKTPTRYMVKGALNDIVGKGRKDTFLCNVDTFHGSPRSLGFVMRRIIENT